MTRGTFLTVFLYVLLMPLFASNFIVYPRVEEPVPLVNDAFIAPDVPRGLYRFAPVHEPGYYETSEYMIGKIVVGIVFLESNGAIDPSTEDWTSTEESAVISEITAGLTWWAGQNPAAGVSFTYDIHYRVPPSYEPISRPAFPNQSLWISEAMTYLGFPLVVNYFRQVLDYINAIRVTYGTDWAYAMFIVDSFADPNGMFADNYFAYAYLGGPFLVMTYDNDGYGIRNMDYVAAHETGHIFYATDEYNGVTEYSGYLNVADVEGSGCLMQKLSWTLSAGTWGQVGWRDTDGDGIQDIVDTFPASTLNPYAPDPTTDVILTYTGTVCEQPYPNNNPDGTGRDVTINTIASEEFRVDGGPWSPATATDGTFDEEFEDFTFATPSLSLGTHVIEVQGINSVGNIEGPPYASDNITIVAFYIVSVSSSGLMSSSYTTHIYVDGVDQGPPYLWDGTSRSYTFDAGTTHTISVDEYVVGPPDTRYHCTDYTRTITITSPQSIVFVYDTEYFLTVNTNPSGLDAPTGEGWYDDGASAPISVSSVSGFTFQYWYLDGQSETPYSYSMSTTVTMNAPHTATAYYKASSTITVSCNPTSISYGSSTTISGDINPDHSGVPVTLSYSLDGGSTWEVFLVVKTNSTGGYSVTWIPPYPLTYVIKAYWEGDADHAGATSSPATLTVSGTMPPQPSLLITLPDASFSSGETVLMTVTVFNPTSTVLDTTLYVQITEPDGYYHFDFTPIVVDANSFASYIFTWAIPSEASVGTYTIKAGLIPPMLTAYDAGYVGVK